jgi:hypothetical protein
VIFLCLEINIDPVKIKIIVLLACLPTFFGVQRGVAQQKIEKATFYQVMDGGDIAAIANELTVVEASSTNNKEGYEGALLMRQAGMEKRPKKKLDLFKAGRIKLETALMNDKDNTEFHFLRLAIEEHAPKIVKYHSDIQSDKAIVVKNFKDLSPAVQQAIRQYCKRSTVLHAEEF